MNNNFLVKKNMIPRFNTVVGGKIMANTEKQLIFLYASIW